MRFLHHPATARPAPQPLDRFGGRRDSRARAKRRQRNQSHRARSHRLRSRPKRRHDPRTFAARDGTSTIDSSGFGFYTPILTFSIYRCSSSSATAIKSANTSISLFNISANRCLQRMRRGKSGSAVREAVSKLRQAIPGLTLRTSLIVGFPGESEADFAELLDFVEEAQFERLGVFKYSEEEGTAAARMPRQGRGRRKRTPLAGSDGFAIRDFTKKERGLDWHYSASYDRRASILTPTKLTGRTQAHAPEVDGAVYVEGFESGRRLTAQAGDMIDVRITGASDYDLIGEILHA